MAISQYLALKVRVLKIRPKKLRVFRPDSVGKHTGTDRSQIRTQFCTLMKTVPFSRIYELYHILSEIVYSDGFLVLKSTFTHNVTMEVELFCCNSLSEAYYWCLNAMNCTGKNMTTTMLLALGEADANMYLCSKHITPGEKVFIAFSGLVCRWVSFYSSIIHLLIFTRN